MIPGEGEPEKILSQEIQQAPRFILHTPALAIKVLSGKLLAAGCYLAIASFFNSAGIFSIAYLKAVLGIVFLLFIT